MKKILIGVTAVLAALTASFAIYVSIYYRADSSVAPESRWRRRHMDGFWTARRKITL